MLAELSQKLSEIESEIEAMQLARDSLKERLQASEGAVSACLRAYSATPNDASLKRVDEAKTDEADARKRLHTTNDSMALRKKDLAKLRKEYDELKKEAVRVAKVALIKTRKGKKEAQLKKIHLPLVEVLTTLHLEGVPIGMVDIHRYLLSQYEDLKGEVQKNVVRLLKGLEHAD